MTGSDVVLIIIAFGALPALGGASYIIINKGKEEAVLTTAIVAMLITGIFAWDWGHDSGEKMGRKAEEQFIATEVGRGGSWMVTGCKTDKDGKEFGCQSYTLVLYEKAKEECSEGLLAGN